MTIEAKGTGCYVRIYLLPALRLASQRREPLVMYTGLRHTVAYLRYARADLTATGRVSD